eukprot:g27392.t1
MQKDLRQRVEGLERLVLDLQVSLRAKESALQDWESRFQVTGKENGEQYEQEKQRSSPDSMQRELVTLRQNNLTQKDCETLRER